ncbi:MAG: DUF4375 domain-containing protein [Planctomycetota bacterium]|nr:DUF4375 domain-containing protein [Planctomycetota bacterium]
MAKYENLMRGIKERRIYQRIDKDILSEIPDDKVLRSIYDCINGNKLDSSDSFPQLSPETRAVYACTLLNWEVVNGGFIEFLYVYAEDFLHEALLGLKFIGANAHHDIVSRVSDLTMKDGSADEALEDAGVLAQLFPLNNEYTELCQSQALEPIIVSFARTHSAKILVEPDAPE